MGSGDVRGIRARDADRPNRTSDKNRFGHFARVVVPTAPGGWLRGHVAWHGAAPKESERMTKILSAALKRDKRI